VSSEFVARENPLKSSLAQLRTNAYLTKQSTFNLRAIEKFKKNKQKSVTLFHFWGIQYICSNPLGHARIEGVSR